MKPLLVSRSKEPYKIKKVNQAITFDSSKMFTVDGSQIKYPESDSLVKNSLFSINEKIIEKNKASENSLASTYSSCGCTCDRSMNDIIIGIFVDICFNAVSIYSSIVKSMGIDININFDEIRRAITNNIGFLLVIGYDKYNYDDIGQLTCDIDSICSSAIHSIGVYVYNTTMEELSKYIGTQKYTDSFSDNITNIVNNIANVFANMMAIMCSQTSNNISIIVDKIQYNRNNYNK